MVQAGSVARARHPARPMPAGVLVPGKWDLVLVAAPCDAACGDLLYRTRQVRSLLKGDVERVDQAPADGRVQRGVAERRAERLHL